MKTPGPVHFIYLGGPFVWQHARAIVTAEVHDAPIILWHDSSVDPHEWSWGQVAGRCVNVELRPLDLPPWLADHPIRLANVKDLYAWRILCEHGGLYLDLDTISLAPVWDMLEADVLVSMEHDVTYRDDHPYNSAVVAARRGAPVLDLMAADAERLLREGVSQWGSCGPRLLTRFVRAYPANFAVAPFGVLNGWRDGTIRRYYEGEPPGPECRVIHLFSSSNMDAFLADRWMP